MNVLGRVLHEIEIYCPVEKWPHRLKQSYIAEKNLANHRRNSLFWELEMLADIFSDIDIRLTLLKGSAYLTSGFNFARYRSFGDIDILVSEKALPESEKRLMINGWVTTKNDPYDQYYYRTWMHELPPMQHMHRGTNLDIHHRILPRTAKYKPDPRLMLGNARQASELPRVDVLSHEDMILHASAHLFSESEDDNAFRNLLDIRDLLKLGLCEEKFSFQKLVDRSVELDLVIPLALAVRYLERVFGQEEAISLKEVLSIRKLQPTNIAIWDSVFEPIFQIVNPLISDKKKYWARLLLRVRGHYLRMPLSLLIPHLLRKSIRPNNQKKQG